MIHFNGHWLHWNRFSKSRTTPPDFPVLNLVPSQSIPNKASRQTFLDGKRKSIASSMPYIAVPWLCATIVHADRNMSSEYDQLLFLTHPILQPCPRHFEIFLIIDDT